MQVQVNRNGVLQSDGDGGGDDGVAVVVVAAGAVGEMVLEWGHYIRQV